MIFCITMCLLDQKIVEKSNIINCNVLWFEIVTVLEMYFCLDFTFFKLQSHYTLKIPFGIKNK